VGGREERFCLGARAIDALTAEQRAGLMGRMITAIFQRDLPFVYGLANTPDAGAAKVYRHY